MTGNVKAKTWVEVSASALANNLAALRAVLEPGVSFCAVVKANAYGHGLKEFVRLALKENVTVFAVDNIDEALAVRALAPAAEILILGYTLPDRLEDVVRSRSIQTVYDQDILVKLAEAGRANGTPALISLKLETGLHRQGLDRRELLAVLEAFGRVKEWIAIVGAGSHFASSEDLDHPVPTVQQTEYFQDCVDYLRTQGIEPTYLHIACSAAALVYPPTQGTLVRVGIALYGLWPSSSVRRTVILGRRRVDLQPVLSWKTVVAQVKALNPGDGVGYGAAYVANRPMRIAVLPVGYYDGYDRGLSNRGEVIIHGVRCAVLGNICMNMLMVDVSHVPGVKAGDVVTLLGRDGMHAVTADDMAERLGTINYEVVTRINPLLPRTVV